MDCVLKHIYSAENIDSLQPSDVYKALGQQHFTGAVLSLLAGQEQKDPFGDQKRMFHALVLRSTERFEQKLDFGYTQNLSFFSSIEESLDNTTIMVDSALLLDSWQVFFVKAITVKKKP